MGQPQTDRDRFVRTDVDKLKHDVVRLRDEDIDVSYPQRLFLRTGAGLRYQLDVEAGPFLCLIDDAGAVTVVGPSASGPLLITATAGEALGGDRAVYVSPTDGKAYYADNSAAAVRLACGLTTGAAVLGADVTIQVDGVIQNLGWAWTGTSPVYLGATGLLTQTPPASGYIMQIGSPVGTNRLRIEPQFIALV